MASADLARTGTSQLEEFAALNDELAGLVRAGLPLELGLTGGGRRAIAGRVTERLRQGRSLDEALGDLGNDVPPAYRAVVLAGLRSGRLAEAVETVARTARAMASLRRRLSLAVIYPAFLLVAAFVLAVLILPRMLTTVVRIVTDAGDRPPALADTALWLLRDNPTYWQFWLPVGALGLLWLSGGLTSATMRLPGLAGAMRSYRLSAFADLAAGLLDHGVPLDEALALSAAASGDSALAADAGRVVEGLRAGRPVSEAVNGFESMPRFARWMIGAGAAGGTLPATLRQIAEWSGRRAAARADWFSLVAPLVVTLLVGGGAVVAFAAASFGPVIDLLYRLTGEASG